MKYLSTLTLLLFFIFNAVSAQQNVPDTGCTGQDTYDQGVRIVPNANSWKDSYQANGFCFCKSSFDHGVGEFQITINGAGRNIKDICDELKKHPYYRDLANGDPRYNTIQCGNEPGHDDAITIQGKRIKDEKVCPGRVDQGSMGCQCKGPKFDMDWLSSRPRFGGDGNEDNTGPNVSFSTPSNNATFTAPATMEVIVVATDNDGVSNVRLYLNNAFVRQENVSPYTWNNNNQDDALKNLSVGSYTIRAEATDSKGAKTTKSISFTVGDDNGGGSDDVVSIFGETISKYVSSENGDSAMNCNRNAAGSLEQFVMESAGNGTISFKGNNGKYVSSENGSKPMNCNRDAVGSWERFTLESLGGNVYAIKGNNGKYVSHENGNKPMNCNRNAVGTWERFVIDGVNSARLNELAKVTDINYTIDVYPLPINSNNTNLTISIPRKVTYSSIEIIDLKGTSIAQKDLGSLESGTKSFALSELNQTELSSGLYILKVRLDGTVITKKIAKQ